MIKDFVENLYNNGLNVLFYFLGDENFTSARYIVINTILFLWYEPAILLTSIISCLFVLIRNRNLNNLMLGLNAFMLLIGIFVMSSLCMPNILSQWFDGNWIIECENFIHDIYFWIDNNIVKGLAVATGITYKESNIFLFVMLVPSLVIVLNSILLFANRHNRSISWWVNCIIFISCFVLGLTEVLYFGLL